MDYETKERLKALRENMKSYGYIDGVEELDSIFPELRENEDESIRKELIEFIKWSVDRHFMREDFHQAKRPPEWIAYLEKQKYDRMKPIYDARESFESALEKAWNDYHNGYENVDKLEDDYVECAHAKGFREGYLFGIEKQKEQKPNFDTHWENGSMVCEQKEQKYYWKPTETDVALFNKAVTTNKTLIPTERAQLDIIRSKFGYCRAVNCSGIVQKEQKPAEWNSEDEQNLNVCLSYIKDEPLRSWLKDAIHVRYVKPAEWSEEDEEMLECVIMDVESAKENYLKSTTQVVRQGAILSDKELAWLKSLRPNKQD